jgi:hypothetical protein
VTAFRVQSSPPATVPVPTSAVAINGLLLF